MIDLDLATADQLADNEEYLAANGYVDIEAWGLDSDYVLCTLDCDCGWVDLDDNPVDLHTQLVYAREAAEED